MATITSYSKMSIPQKSTQTRVPVFVAAWVCLVVALAVARGFASSVEYAYVNAGGVPVHVVVANLNDPEVRVTCAIARGGVGSHETFGSMISRTQPTAAITGTFFCTRTYVPTGDIGIGGALVHTGCIGGALCIDQSGRAKIVDRAEGRKTLWAGYETVLCAGPRLVRDGKMWLAVKEEGFGGSLYSPAYRTGVGLTDDGKLLLMAVARKISLQTIAQAMIALGAKDALCLDGGSSTALYFNGSYPVACSRQLTNWLLVYSSDSAYQMAKAKLAPGNIARAGSTRAAPLPSPTPAPQVPPASAMNGGAVEGRIYAPLKSNYCVADDLSTVKGNPESYIGKIIEVRGTLLGLSTMPSHSTLIIDAGQYGTQFVETTTKPDLHPGVRIACLAKVGEKSTLSLSDLKLMAYVYGGELARMEAGADR